MEDPDVSVVVPTYNRSRSLHGTLESVSQQRYPMERIEVVLVDDGSTDGTSAVALDKWPFTLAYVSQANTGDAIARNTGALRAKGERLLFLDDDIILDDLYISESLAALRRIGNHRIVIGRCQTVPVGGHASSFSRAELAVSPPPSVGTVPFSELCSNNMLISRADYLALGMMRGLGFPGSDLWCDVEFAYRAHLNGYKVYRCDYAVCFHRDRSMADLSSAADRLEQMGSRAVHLFREHQDLQYWLPMFDDKNPIRWNRDSVQLIARKIGRSMLASDSSMAFLYWTVSALEQLNVSPQRLRPLYRWILGGRLFQGFRSESRILAKSALGGSDYSVSK